MSHGFRLAPCVSAAISRTRGPPRPRHHVPAAAPPAESASASRCGQPELTELLEPLFDLVKAAAPQKCLQRRPPAPGRLDRKPQGQGLLESLTRDGPGHDRPVRHACSARQVLIEDVPDHARCPSHRFGLLQPRECVADVAEVEQGDGSAG